MKDAAPKTGKKLSPSLEDYLEAILSLVHKGKVARVRDIARRLKVGMPSVCVALRALSRRGLVNYDPYQVITLTERGERLGEGIDRRHKMLQDFLIDVLRVENGIAQANACRMEHAIDDEVLERLRHLAGFMKRCRRTRENWAKALRQMKRQGHFPQQRRQCPAGRDAQRRPHSRKARLPLPASGR